MGWYPVEWDVSQFKGKTVVVEVGDFSPTSSISVDNFEFYNSRMGCLPTCMDIRDDICDGETCFYLEMDEVPYRKVKSLGAVKGVYCRDGAKNLPGSAIGPGVLQMSKGPGDASLWYVAATNLPRCMQIDLRGSHYAVSTVDAVLGETRDQLEFAYSREPQFADPEHIHCIYPTLEPRCVAYSKPVSAFKSWKRSVCATELYETNCLDQCFKIHCSDQAMAGRACGNDKAFQDCAYCCESNFNVASGCFRRRRRLGAALESISSEAQGGFSDYDCAEACLDTPGCMAYRIDDGVCSISSRCDQGRADEPAFQKSTWNILRGMTEADLGRTPPEEKKKKKRRRKKAAPAVDAPEVAEAPEVAATPEAVETAPV